MKIGGISSDDIIGTLNGGIGLATQASNLPALCTSIGDARKYHRNIFKTHLLLNAVIPTV